MCGGKNLDETAVMEGELEPEVKFCSGPSRVIFLIFNFIIWVGSCALLALGIYVLVDSPFTAEVFKDSNDFLLVAIVLIVVGGIGFLISFIGCCGAFLKSKCLVLMHVVVLIILLAVLLIGAILGFLFRDRLEGAAIETMRDTLASYDKQNQGSAKVKAWDSMQKALKCCGVMRYSDWETYNEDFKGSADKIPTSCCVINADTQRPQTGCERATNRQDFFSRDEDGCHTKLLQLMASRVPYIAIVAGVVAFCMVVGVVLGVILYTRL